MRRSRGLASEILRGRPTNASVIFKGGQRRPRAVRVKPLTAILRIVAAQFGVGLLAVLAAYLLAGRVAAGSALLGSLICALPNAILGMRIAAAGATGDARRMMRATYVAVAIKLLVTAALFATVFVLVRPLAAGWLFAGFIVTQATMWAAPVLTGEGFTAPAGKPARRAETAGDDTLGRRRA